MIGVALCAAAFAGGRAFGGNVLGIMIAVALCLGIGGLGMVVLGGDKKDSVP